MAKINIICFLGVDGSGKSTLSTNLFSELKKCSNVSYVWWLEGENSFIRKLIRKVGSFNQKGVYKQDYNKSSNKKNGIKNRMFKLIYPKIVLLDYIIFGIKKTWIPCIGSKNKILIFDRYFYDVIFALSREFNFSDNTRLKTFNLFKTLFPDPDLVFVIEVPPEISYSRKKDEILSVKNAKLMRSNYEDIYSLLDSKKMIRIDNTQELEFVKQKILNITLNHVGEF